MFVFDAIAAAGCCSGCVLVWACVCGRLVAVFCVLIAWAVDGAVVGLVLAGCWSRAETTASRMSPSTEVSCWCVLN